MKRHSSSACDSMFLGLCENLGEDVHSVRCRDIQKHLHACADCRTYLAALRKTIELYRRYPAPRLSQRSHRKLLSNVRKRVSRSA